MKERPRPDASGESWFHYTYTRVNEAGAQREWWYHRSGCRAWFYAERDTRTNVVLWTALPGSEPAEVVASEAGNAHEELSA